MYFIAIQTPIPMPMSIFIKYKNPHIYDASLENTLHIISFSKQTCHSIQVMRSTPQRTPGTFVSLLYMHDIQDVCDTHLQEFKVVQFSVEIYLHTFCNCNRSFIEWKKKVLTKTDPLTLSILIFISSKIRLY